MRELPRERNLERVVRGTGVIGEQSYRSVITDTGGVASGVLAHFVVVIRIDAGSIDNRIGFDKTRQMRALVANITNVQQIVLRERVLEPRSSAA